jgi:hypothetical protein
MLPVEDMIADQRDFVAWWDANIGVRHGAGRGHKNNADLHSFSMEDAERLTGIKQWKEIYCKRYGDYWVSRLNSGEYCGISPAPFHRRL